MTDWAFSILFALLLLFSIYIGFLSGQGVCARYVVERRDYWVANIAGCVVAIVFIALIAWLPLLYAVAVGGLAGYIAGLRMSFGEAVGPWKLLEKFIGLNGWQRAGANAGAQTSVPVREQRRRAKRNGGAAPDLMSVEQGAHGQGAHGASQDASRPAPSSSKSRSSKKGAR